MYKKIVETDYRVISLYSSIGSISPGIGYAPEVGEPIEDDITQAYWDLQHDVSPSSV